MFKKVIGNVLTISKATIGFEEGCDGEILPVLVPWRCEVLLLSWLDCVWMTKVEEA